MELYSRDLSIETQHFRKFTAIPSYLNCGYFYLFVYSGRGRRTRALFAQSYLRKLLLEAIPSILNKNALSGFYYCNEKVFRLVHVGFRTLVIVVAMSFGYRKLVIGASLIPARGLGRFSNRILLLLK